MPAFPPPSYSAKTLAATEQFPDCLASAAQDLLQTHLDLPREVHYVADLPRWMLSQVTVAMHFEHRLDPARPPISPNNLVEAVKTARIASRNTIHGFLQEMRRYSFVEPLPCDDRRRRTVQATAMSEQLIRRYFDIHLRALDRVDDGGRYALSCQFPDLLSLAQPRFARLLLACEGWHRPPQSIVKFVRSDSGSSVLHDLVSTVPSLPDDATSPIWVGNVSPGALSARYRISKTHTARLFRSAKSADLIGWANRSNRGECWVSPALVRAYRLWQAEKLAAVSQAFNETCRIGNIASPLG